MRRKLKRWGRRALRRLLKPAVLDIINKEVRIWGDPGRLTVAPSAGMNNTLFNTSSGRISVGAYAFAGHDVSVITGTHDHHQLLKQRLCEYPQSGRNIVIGAGVWLGSGAIILGPCTIGDHAVVAAGAVVTPGSRVPAGAIVGGIPATQIGQVPLGADE